ncbi:MAG: hypothetical protein E7097_01445 [Bacteroides sp.]|nr:hypothetical protein [Bacteroides sp.]
MDKLSNALDILDFSFLISGGTTLGIVYIYLTYFQGLEFTLLHQGFIGICCILLIAYVCGLFSWSIGKYIRRKYFLKTTDKNANQSNEDHCFETLFNTINDNISSNPKNQYPFKDNTLNYTYMWNKIAQSKDVEVQERYNFINKYWVMQAIFEGLIGSAMIGIILCLLSITQISYIEYTSCGDFCNNWQSIIGKCNYAIGALIAFIILLLRSAVEARKNAEVQIKEVVIAYYLFFIEPKKYNRIITL